MASITDLVIHLSTGRSIGWIGSGPSIDMGLPDWRKLANGLLEACRRQQHRNFHSIEALYREGQYPEMFDEVERSYGRDFLIERCRELLQDPGRVGDIYQAIASMGFLAYLTTNYDDALLRHLEQSGRAFTKYLNGEEDLASVDVDTTPALIKLHGEFSNPTSAILTRGDYQRWYVRGEGSGFRQFLRLFLGRDRLVFIGYSMSDPEILQLQEEMQANIRRKVRSIALLTNVPEHTIDRWKIDYNIDVLPYRTVDGDHSELRAILASVNKVLSVGRIATEMNTAEELKRAEALYLWYRFLPGNNGTAVVDALQSVVLSLLVDCPDGMNIESIKGRISDMGIPMAVRVGDLENSIANLVQSEWIFDSEGIYRVQPEKKSTIHTFERRFEDMMSTFTRQVTMDAIKLCNVSEEVGPVFANLVVETLIDIFESRGREILNVAFAEGPISPSGALELIETVWRRANRLSDPADRPKFVQFVLTTMFEPTGIYENVLNYFAKAFFCIQALGANRTVQSIVADVINDRAFLIDANILIPLVARHEDRQKFVDAVVRACRMAGIQLYTTESSLQEVRRHINWANNLVQDFGTMSPEVLYAATGEGDYAANAFLKGFIALDPNSRDRSFFQYIRDCFGGSYSHEQFRNYFYTEFGIAVLEQNVVDGVKEQYQKDFDDASMQIAQWNSQRKEEERKSPIRIGSEAEAFVTVLHWDAVKDMTPAVDAERCSYLTYGTTVRRLYAPDRDRHHMMAVPPEVVWEVLTTLDGVAYDNLPEFRSLMSAS